MQKRPGVASAPLTDDAAVAMKQMELYCIAHPGSPSAVRCPQLFIRDKLWVALLGPSVEEGIVGIGPTVAAALRAFDVQYLAGRGRRARRSSLVGHFERIDAGWLIATLHNRLNNRDANYVTEKGFTRG